MPRRAVVAFGVLGALLALEQVVLRLRRRTKKGSSLPGPSWVVPFVGGLIEMIKDPAGFWEKQRLYCPEGLSANYLLGTFMIFSTNNDVNRAVLSNNGDKGFIMALHPNARMILGDSNIAFLHGQEHKELRNSFLSLFGRTAMGRYVTMQEEKVRAHLGKWQALAEPTEMRAFMRDLNLETSQYVFLGRYVKDPAEFERHYLNMTKGFVVPPIPLPGFALYDAIQSRKAIIPVIEDCVARSKAAMAAGVEPHCLLDFWVQRCLADEAEAVAAGKVAPLYTGNHRMAETMMDFLFASQDATTAGLCWILAMCADHPEVAAKVREEQLRLRPHDEPIDYDVLLKMDYTRQVVLECLRYRPPAMMVPQLAACDVKLTEGVTAPKGSMVIPSLWASCRNGYANGEVFDPSRFAEDREDTWEAHKKSWMVFGCGAHACVGQQYSIHHLTAFLAVVAGRCDFVRKKTPRSDDVDYLPTLYPFDCLMTLKPLSA